MLRTCQSYSTTPDVALRTMGLAPVTPRVLALVNTQVMEAATLESIHTEMKSATDGGRNPNLSPEQHLFFQECFGLGYQAAEADYRAMVRAGVVGLGEEGPEDGSGDMNENDTGEGEA